MAEKKDESKGGFERGKAANAGAGGSRFGVVV
jgi:hypothetical protein